MLIDLPSQIYRDELMLCLTHVAPGVTVGVLPGSVIVAGDKQLGAPLNTESGVGRFRQLEIGVWIHVIEKEFEISRFSGSNGMIVEGTRAISRKPVVITSGPAHYLHNRIDEREDEKYDKYVSLYGEYLLRNEKRALSHEGTIQFALDTIALQFFDRLGTTLVLQAYAKEGLVVSTVETEREVWLVKDKTHKVTLSKDQRKILLFLMQQKHGKFVSNDDIIKHVWGDNSTAALFNAINELRKKLLELDAKYEYIENGGRGLGYRFNKQAI